MGISLEAFDADDVYIDYPYEERKFRYVKATQKVFACGYGKSESEILHSDLFFRVALSAGNEISREECYRVYYQ